MVAQTGIPVTEFQPFETAVQQFMQRWDVPGVSVAYGYKGQLVYTRAFGYADRARTEPLQPYHLLRVASISKPITALAVMQLVEQGRIDLAAKVFGPQGYLRRPYYTAAITDPRLYDVTVQQLLEHTAGWDRRIGCDGYGGCDPIDFPLHVAETLHAPTPVADSTLIRFILTKGLNYAPGTHFAYSNMGYLVLGKVIEAVTGEPYEAWVRQHLLEPAGALEAHLGHSLPANRLEREAEYRSGYQMPACNGSGQTVPAAYGGFNLEAMNAHGGWVCSARALVRLLMAADGEVGPAGLLRPASWEEMAQPSAVNAGYAKGWLVNGAGNRWHGGELDGTGAYLVHTAGDITWAILLNTRPGSAACWRALDRLGWAGAQPAATLPTHDWQPPTQNATALTATPNAAGVLLRWASGTGTRRLVLLQPDQPVASFPEDGQRYSGANADWGQALGQNTYVVADVTTDSVQLRHLALQHAYHVRVVEYAENAVTGYRPVYLLDGNPTLVLPAVAETAVAAGAAKWQLYPNPTHDALTVAGVTQPLPYEVLTLQGQRLQSSVLQPGSTISLAQLSPGAYLIRLQTPEQQVFRRFVKE